MWENLQLLLGGAFVLLLGVSALARRFPRVAWIQKLRYDPPKLTDEQQAKIRRRADVYAGVELILLGVALPMVYFAMTVMFFNTPTVLGLALVGAGSVLCVGLGLIAISGGRRRKRPSDDLDARFAAFMARGSPGKVSESSEQQREKGI